MVSLVADAVDRYGLDKCHAYYDPEAVGIPGYRVYGSAVNHAQALCSVVSGIPARWLVFRPFSLPLISPICAFTVAALKASINNNNNSVNAHS